MINSQLDINSQDASISSFSLFEPPFEAQNSADIISLPATAQMLAIQDGAALALDATDSIGTNLQTVDSVIRSSSPSTLAEVEQALQAMLDIVRMEKNILTNVGNTDLQFLPGNGNTTTSNQNATSINTNSSGNNQNSNPLMEAGNQSIEGFAALDSVFNDFDLQLQQQIQLYQNISAIMNEVRQLISSVGRMVTSLFNSLKELLGSAGLLPPATNDLPALPQPPGLPQQPGTGLLPPDVVPPVDLDPPVAPPDVVPPVDLDPPVAPPDVVPPVDLDPPVTPPDVVPPVDLDPPVTPPDVVPPVDLDPPVDTVIDYPLPDPDVVDVSLEVLEPIVDWSVPQPFPEWNWYRSLSIAEDASGQSRLSPGSIDADNRPIIKNLQSDEARAAQRDMVYQGVTSLWSKYGLDYTRQFGDSADWGRSRFPYPQYLNLPSASGDSGGTVGEFALFDLRDKLSNDMMNAAGFTRALHWSDNRATALVNIPQVQADFIHGYFGSELPALNDTHYAAISTRPLEGELMNWLTSEDGSVSHEKLQEKAMELSQSDRRLAMLLLSNFTRNLAGAADNPTPFAEGGAFASSVYSVDNVRNASEKIERIDRIKYRDGAYSQFLQTPEDSIATIAAFYSGAVTDQYLPGYSQDNIAGEMNTGRFAGEAEVQELSDLAAESLKALHSNPFLSAAYYAGANTIGSAGTAGFSGSRYSTDGATGYEILTGGESASALADSIPGATGQLNKITAEFGADSYAAQNFLNLLAGSNLYRKMAEQNPELSDTSNSDIESAPGNDKSLTQVNCNGAVLVPPASNALPKAIQELINAGKLVIEGGKIILPVAAEFLPPALAALGIAGAVGIAAKAEILRIENDTAEAKRLFDQALGKYIGRKVYNADGSVAGVITLNSKTGEPEIIPYVSLSTSINVNPQSNELAGRLQGQELFRVYSDLSKSFRAPSQLPPSIYNVSEGKSHATTNEERQLYAKLMSTTAKENTDDAARLFFLAPDSYTRAAIVNSLTEEKRLSVLSAMRRNNTTIFVADPRDPSNVVVFKASSPGALSSSSGTNTPVANTGDWSNSGANGGYSSERWTKAEQDWLDQYLQERRRLEATNPDLAAQQAEGLDKHGAGADQTNPFVDTPPADQGLTGTTPQGIRPDLVPVNIDPSPVPFPVPSPESLGIDPSGLLTFPGGSTLPAGGLNLPQDFVPQNSLSSPVFNSNTGNTGSDNSGDGTFDWSTWGPSPLTPQQQEELAQRLENASKEAKERLKQSLNSIELDQWAADYIEKMSERLEKPDPYIRDHDEIYPVEPPTDINNN